MYNIIVNEVIRSFVDIKPTEIILPNFPVIVGVKRDEKSDFFCLLGERGGIRIHLWYCLGKA